MSSIYEQLSKAEVSSKSDIPEADLSIPKFNQPLGPSKSKKGFFSVFATLLLIAAVGVGGFLLYNVFQQERKELRELSSRYEELKAASLALQEQGYGSRAEMDDLQKAFQRIRSETTDARKGWERTRIDVSNMEKKMLELEDRTGQIEAAVADLKPRAVAMGPLPAEEYGAANEEISRSDESSAVPSAGNAQEISTPTPSLEESLPSISVPQVMTVNRKFNFIVINMGSKDNIRMGDRLMVERDGKIIGAVAVEKLYDNFAAAAIVEEKKNGEIKEGDIVRKS